jgi:hypothetical protein
MTVARLHKLGRDGLTRGFLQHDGRGRAAFSELASPSMGILAR